MSRPGDRLRAFAADWCCADTMARFIDPAVADLQHEYTLVSMGGSVLRTIWVRVCGYASIARVMLLCIANGAIGGSAWTGDDRQAIVRVLCWSVVPAALMVVLLELFPFLLYNLRARDPLLLVYLLPQALPFAINVGATIGIVGGLGGRAFSRRVSAAVIAAALVVSFASFANFGWLAPAANQSFRVAVTRGNGFKVDPPRGYPELTLGELRRELDRARGDLPIIVSPSSFRISSFFYYSRWALSFTPLLFAAFGLLLAHTRIASRWVLGTTATVAFLGYYMVLDFERVGRIDGPLPAGAGAWYPNVALIFISTLLMLSRFRRSRRDVAAG